MHSDKVSEALIVSWFLLKIRDIFDSFGYHCMVKSFSMLVISLLTLGLHCES